MEQSPITGVSTVMFSTGPTPYKEIGRQAVDYTLGAAVRPGHLGGRGR